MSSITKQLKLKAQDGKYRVTDVVDIEGMFRIIELVSSKNALNYEYVDEKEIEMK